MTFYETSEKRAEKSSGYDQRDGSWRYSTDNEWDFTVCLLTSVMKM